MNDARFSRQIILGPVGVAGQDAISKRTMRVPEGEGALSRETARRYALGAGYHDFETGGAAASRESLEPSDEFRSKACREIARGTLLVLDDLRQLLDLNPRKS